MARKSRKRHKRRRSEAAERALSIVRNLLLALLMGIVILAIISVQTEPSSLGLGQEGES